MTQKRRTTSILNGEPLKDATGLVTFHGVDDWDRALFKTRSGIIVVSVDGELYSRNVHECWAEPCTPLGYATPELPDDVNKDAILI